MVNILLIGLLAIIITIILWPPIIIFYLIVSIYPISLILIHKHGSFMPHWTFGNDPSSEINVYYRNDEDNNCILQYSPLNENRWQKTNKSPHYSLLNPNPSVHYFILQNLLPGTKYEFIIQDQRGNKIKHAKGTFFTQDHDKKIHSHAEFRIGIFGDFQIGENLEIIETYFIHLLRKHKPELIISLGDNVHKYNDFHAWRVHNTILRKLIRSIPFYTTPGNHDYGADMGKFISLEAAMLPITKTNEWHYSFEYKGVYFISLLSQRLNDEKYQQDQLFFLEHALSDAEQQKKLGNINWIIIYTHVPWWGPPYNDKNPNDKDELWIKEHWVPLFEQHGVDLFFAGHKHSYCRDKNKIITGSMHGVRRYPEKTEKEYILRNSHQLCIVTISAESLQVESKTWFNKNIEVFKINKKL